ncbi:MAG: sulfurtransferase [Hydrogenophilaceae bacterium]|nr:sulfurtransferase [Hydrogenophilaceae bacterium]
MSILNISTYKFVTLDDREALRDRIQQQCDALGLKGTILLAPEGINIFLAAEASAIHAFLEWLRQDSRFADIAAKESWSGSVPFRKMRVRLKKEIITMKVSDIRPEDHRAESVSPVRLKAWLDRGHDDLGREIVMIDTRNVFEVEAGTFVNALDFGIERFSQYPQAIAARRNDFSGKTVVTFCTGGIRCEKAVLYMNRIGMEGVYQLDGGILKYFEEVGGAHWTGNCVVFDDRNEVDPALRPARETLPHR